MSDMVRVVVEIPKETYLEIKEGSIVRNAIESAEAIKSGTLLLKGHEITNGEVMQTLFPYIEVSTYGLLMRVKGLDCNKGALDPYRYFDSDWWNAPYRVEREG